MNADERGYLNELSEHVIGAAFEVSNVLGVGFLERVYEAALAAELSSRGLVVERQKHLPVFYKGVNVGDYYADLVVNEKLIVEIKCADGFAPEHIAQTLNYLRASDRRLALLLNFKRSKLDFKRIVHGF